MIKRETEKRILNEICINELNPILEKFNFKFLSSKSCFIRKGKVMDIVIYVYNISQPIQLNENDELIFNYNLRTSFQLSEFDKWHKKIFKKNSTNLTNSKFKAYSFYSKISTEIFQPSDFYEPSAAKYFKINVTSLISRNTSQNISYKISDLSHIISNDIIPDYSELDEIKSLLDFNNIPHIVKADLLYYSGQYEESKILYTDLYRKLNKQIETEDQVSNLSFFSQSMTEIEYKYEILFKDKINPSRNKTIVTINKNIKNDITLGQHIFSLLGSFTKIIPPVDYNSILMMDHERGIDFQKDSILIKHHQNILSKWDLNLSLLEESEYEHKNDVFHKNFIDLIPTNAYFSATCLNQDSSYIFTGGYDTKSYLIDTRTRDKKVLWAHETFREGYKDDYKVSHNFGVNQAKFILKDKYILACACHAKNVVWDTTKFERKELSLPHEYTFKGAPPSTEFANDVKQICIMNSLDLFGLLIREDVLIFNNSFELVKILKSVKQIHYNQFNDTLVLIRIDNNIDIYSKITTGNNALDGQTC